MPSAMTVTRGPPRPLRVREVPRRWSIADATVGVQTMKRFASHVGRSVIAALIVWSLLMVGGCESDQAVSGRWTRCRLKADTRSMQRQSSRAGRATPRYGQRLRCARPVTTPASISSTSPTAYCLDRRGVRFRSYGWARDVFGWRGRQAARSTSRPLGRWGWT